jgi:hypothetical protein
VSNPLDSASPTFADRRPALKVGSKGRLLSTGLMPVSFETIVGWSRATSVGASGRLIDLM